jgi:hypothetical protein
MGAGGQLASGLAEGLCQAGSRRVFPGRPVVLGAQRALSWGACLSMAVAGARKPYLQPQAQP